MNKNDLIMDKDKLNKFFRELRKSGYFARQNFHCCQTCATSDIPKEHENKYVYYHNQDKQYMDERGIVWLGWAGDGTEIANIAHEAGLIVDWNGSSDSRIRLLSI